MVTKFVAPDATGTDPEQASSERITQFIATLKEQGVEYVRFELPDLHGVSRLKVVPIDKVEGYTRKGLNFYGGTLALDTASMVVSGAGLHEERKYRDHMLIPDLDTLTPVPSAFQLLGLPLSQTSIAKPCSVACCSTLSLC